jgi:hypothetical protein
MAPIIRGFPSRQHSASDVTCMARKLPRAVRTVRSGWAEVRAQCPCIHAPALPAQFVGLQRDVAIDNVLVGTLLSLRT